MSEVEAPATKRPSALKVAAQAVQARLRGKKILLYGPPKIGKTTTAASFPKPYFIAFERGHDFIDSKRADCDYGWEGWVQFQTLLNNIAALSPYDTIIVDTADSAYEDCFEWVCKEEKMSHPSVAAMGKGWDAIKREFAKQMLRLANACKDKHLVFLSHSKIVDVNLAGFAFQRIEPSLKTQAYDVLQKLSDYIVYLGYAIPIAPGMDLRKNARVPSENRNLHMKGSEVMLAGGRDRLVPGVIEDFDGHRGYYEIVTAMATVQVADTNPTKEAKDK